jgi:hypothetical protein
MIHSIVSAMRLPTLLGALFFLSVGVATQAQAQTVNQRPTISGTPPSWVYVGSQYYFRAQGYDPERATLRYSIQNRPSWATFSSSTGVLSGTPTAAGTWYDIRITVSDGVSSSTPLQFSIRAARRDNVAPVISGTPPTSVAVGATYSFQPTASDENRDPITFGIINRPAWMTFSSATGRLIGTPTAANVGTYSNIQIRVSDGRVSAGLAPFTITVTGGTSNRAPTISGAPSTSVTAGQAYSFRPAAADADNDTLGFSIQNRPAWATFSSVTGQLSGTPSTTSVGTYSNIVISVSDGRTSTALAPFAVTVSSAPNRAPTISGTPSTSVNVGSAFAFRPTAADADGNTLTFSISNRPAWATFNSATGQLAGTPTATSAGTYSNIVISVSDGVASAALAPFAISVVDVSNGAATLTWTPPTTNTDGTTLTTLAGYRIAYGTSAANMSQTIQLANAGISSYVVENLAPGTYYFAVRAYTSAGAESVNSNVVTKLVQ